MKNFLGKEKLIIAEVGQNHQGSLEYALKYVEEFSKAGADVIKFQTRNNKYLFAAEAYNKIYDNENSFGETYGLHREKLELKVDWLPIIKKKCHENGVLFMSTPFDEPSLELLCDINVDLLKIASFDLGNLSFINLISKKQIPVVISTGGGNLDIVKKSIQILSKNKIEISVLHCVSEYPTPPERLGLDKIKELKNHFKSCTIGLSDHFNGTLSGPLGYMMGARVFEKHVTLNRSWKGTDHAFALEPNGFAKFVRDINRVEIMKKPKPETELGKEFVFTKLGKSVVAKKNISKGETFKLENLSGLIFNKVYLPVRDSHLILDKKANKDIKKGQQITINDIN